MLLYIPFMDVFAAIYYIPNNNLLSNLWGFITLSTLKCKYCHTRMYLLSSFHNNILGWWGNTCQRN